MCIDKLPAAADLNTIKYHHVRNKRKRRKETIGSSGETYSRRKLFVNRADFLYIHSPCPVAGPVVATVCASPYALSTVTSGHHRARDQV